jgi:peptide/nickel transport system substrate-binding protein
MIAGARVRRHRSPTAMIGVLAVYVVLACAAVIAVEVPAAAASSSTQRNSTFIASADTAFSTFNPFLSINQGELDVLDEIYPYLTFPNEHNLPGPYLATSWKVSSDHLTWTFHIRSGLKWSDGQPLTAADVAWTYDLIMHNQTAATANGSLVTNFKSVTAPDPATVTIRTVKPQANMLDVVMNIPIVPAHVWKAHVKHLGSFTNTDFPVVGYGPYQFTSYNAPQTATMTASKSFFWGPPKYHKLIYEYFSNSSGAVAALRNGTIDTSYQLTDTEWKSLKNAPGVKTYATLTNDWVAVEVNSGARTRSGKPMGDGNPLLHNATIRRAIALAINRAELVKKVAGGEGVVTGSYLTPAFPQWYWTPSPSQAQNYDPAKANAMLDAAGFPKGRNGYRYDKRTGKELSFRLGIHSDSASDAATANYLVGWLKAIGIKLDVQSMSYTQLNDNLAIGNWDLLMDQWPEGPDPTYLLSIQTCGVLPLNKDGNGGNTDSFFCNKRYDKLYAAQQEQFNLQKRIADIKAMERILYNADDDIILYDDAYLWATRDSYLKGFVYGKPNAQGLYPLQNYELGFIKATPAASTSGGGSNSTVIIIVIVVVVLVLAGGGLLLRRRRVRTAEERE